MAKTFDDNTGDYGFCQSKSCEIIYEKIKEIGVKR